MLTRVKSWLGRPDSRQYEELLLRLGNLETAVDVLIESRKFRDDGSAGFNGQKQRKRIFDDLLREFRFDAVVETGTWLGDTAGYMATRSRLPVHSCEMNGRFHSLARMRLSDLSGISLELSDSRAFLRTLAKGPLAGGTIFFYLDAHWYRELPLEEELAIIVGNWKRFVVMIDDFEVPGDSGYRFDDFYEQGSLDLATFLPVFSRLRLAPFFPSAPSQEESGSKRGCVVLAEDPSFSGALGRIPSLKQLPVP